LARLPRMKRSMRPARELLVEAYKRILLKVARCELANPFATRDNACTAVVGAQGVTKRAAFQLPEPWRGDIASAPVLFVSSNPSWNREDDSPRFSDSDDHVAAYYHGGFPSTYPRNVDRQGRAIGRPVAFWSAIRRRAAELYRCSADRLIAGRHFAMTEVVRCKSRAEFGVDAAAEECVSRHLAATLCLSVAPVIVLLGSVVLRVLDLNRAQMPHRRDWYGRERFLLWLPHPNARCRRSVRAIYDDRQLRPVHTVLQSFSPERSCATTSLHTEQRAPAEGQHG
jgi:hypothetical protein